MKAKKINNNWICYTIYNGKRYVYVAKSYSEAVRGVIMQLPQEVSYAK